MTASVVRFGGKVGRDCNGKVMRRATAGCLLPDTLALTLNNPVACCYHSHQDDGWAKDLYTLPSPNIVAVRSGGGYIAGFHLDVTAYRSCVDGDCDNHVCDRIVSQGQYPLTIVIGMWGLASKRISSITISWNGRVPYPGTGDPYPIYMDGGRTCDGGGRHIGETFAFDLSNAYWPCPCNTGGDPSQPQPVLCMDSITVGS